MFAAAVHARLLHDTRAVLVKGVDRKEYEGPDRDLTLMTVRSMLVYSILSSLVGQVDSCARGQLFDLSDSGAKATRDHVLCLPPRLATRAGTRTVRRRTARTTWSPSCASCPPRRAAPSGCPAMRMRTTRCARASPRGSRTSPPVPAHGMGGNLGAARARPTSSPLSAARPISSSSAPAAAAVPIYAPGAGAQATTASATCALRGRDGRGQGAPAHRTAARGEDGLFFFDEELDRYHTSSWTTTSTAATWPSAIMGGWRTRGARVPTSRGGRTGCRPGTWCGCGCS